MSSAHGHDHDHHHPHQPLTIKLNVEDVSAVEKRVVVEIPWEEVRERMNHLYHDLRVGVSIKGFRKGKAPRDVLKQYFGKQLEQDLIHELVRDSFPSVVEQSGLQPVGEPLVEPEKLSEGNPFKYTARVEVKPKVEPKDYMGVALDKRTTSVKDEDVDREVESLRQSHTELVPIEGRTVTQAGDVVRIDFEGKCGKIPLKGKGQQLLLSDSDGLPPEMPGLAKVLVGQALDLKAHEVTLDFPAEHRDPELRGKQAALKVSIVEAKQKQVPNLDDEFAKDTGEAETLVALKDRLRKKLEERDETRIKEELKSQIVKKLLEANQVAVAPVMVERQLDVTLHRAKLQLAMSGVDVSRGVDEQKLREELRGKAQDEVRAGLLLEAIGLRENVQVTDADMEKRLAQIASNRGENVAKVKGEYSRDGRIHAVRRGLLEEKTLDLLITAAKISEATGSP